jgi:hypothetical protein
VLYPLPRVRHRKEYHFMIRTTRCAQTDLLIPNGALKLLSGYRPIDRADWRGVDVDRARAIVVNVSIFI